GLVVADLAREGVAREELDDAADLGPRSGLEHDGRDAVPPGRVQLGRGAELHAIVARAVEVEGLDRGALAVLDPGVGRAGAERPVAGAELERARHGDAVLLGVVFAR